MSVTHADRIAGYSSATHFLNVDLDIRSKHDLQPLVKALGRRVIVLYVGREQRNWSAHLEVARNVRTADAAIWAFCGLIEGLPKPARALWNTANVRGFSIGIQGGMQPNPCDFVIRPKTVRAVSLLGAQIVLTIYALKTYSSAGAVKSTDVAALSKK
jgi:hypothetical protein